MQVVLVKGNVLTAAADVLLISTHSTLRNKDGPGTLLGNIGELAFRRYGDEFESVVGQVDPFPLGTARLERAEDVELPWHWVALLGTLNVTTVGSDSGPGAGRLLSALADAMKLGLAAGALTFVSPVQTGGWRIDPHAAFGIMVQAADATGAVGELRIIERSAERYLQLAELAPSYGVLVD